ncbi:MAG TPA: glucose 1-dehydrogenase [Chloroflexota bacterium]|nr:glucose 1-dehydrogenase [Chloroflexota bacterium]
MPSLGGKVAIVTGAAVGMGRAIAVAYGAEGARVVVNYSKSRAEAEETAEEVRKAGGEPLLIGADVSSDEQVRAMVAQTLDRFGRVDVLVNNAGITRFVPFEDLESLTDEVWDRLYAVNVKGTFFCCRAVAEPMRRQGEGRIINIASVSGLRPTGSSIAYAASKAAVIQASRCLAKALAPEIRVSVIAPGAIAETRWNAGRPTTPAAQQSAANAIPLKRLGRPSDIAEVALFLATGGDYLTGEVIVVDGGRELG